MGWNLHISIRRPTRAPVPDRPSTTTTTSMIDPRTKRFFQKISSFILFQRRRRKRRQHAVPAPHSDSTLTFESGAKAVASTLDHSSLESITDETEDRLAGCVPITIPLASPDQKILLLDLPAEILLLICKRLALQSVPIGSPDEDGEVPKDHFMTEYRRHRTLNFSLVNRHAFNLINDVFFSLNTFEFHYAIDFEKFALGLSDLQRDQIRRLRYFSATTQPYSQLFPYTTEAPATIASSRHFALLTESELVAAARSCQNALALTKTCNRLLSLEIFYRYQIHAESLNRPHSVTWEGRWTRYMRLPSTPPCLEQIARWDYVHSGALECLRGNTEEESAKKTGVSFDFDEPIANELADRIDKFITENDIEVETYQVEPDCNEILSEVVKAREQSIVRDVEGIVVCQIREFECCCCGVKLWKRLPKVDTFDDTLSIYCAQCGSWEFERGCQLPRKDHVSSWVDDKRAKRLARIDKVRFRRREEDIEDDESPEDVLCASGWLLETMAEDRDRLLVQGILKT